MAKNTSRYVQFYTPGSVACKVEIRQEREWAPLPAAKPKPKKAIPVDPVAMFGFLVAVGMLVLMAAGIHHLNTTRQEVAVLEHYVAQLTEENQTLTKQYTEGYDLEDIRVKATDMGMVPVEQVPTVKIEVSVSPLQEEPTAWQALCTFLAGLFA